MGGPSLLDRTSASAALFQSVTIFAPAEVQNNTTAANVIALTSMYNGTISSSYIE
jgi:hypothetical protein